MEIDKTQKVYATSDSHYNHANICGPTISKWKSGYRNFKSLDEMNNTLVNNINELVGQDDVLFHLGDFAWGERNIEWFRNRIICKNVILILGNHDKEIRKRQKFRDLFSEVHDYGFEQYIRGTLFVFNHYSMRVWNGSHRGSIHLYGHSHNTLPPHGRSMDVGVDTNNFYPYDLDDLIVKFNKIPVKFLDQHTEMTD